MANAQEAEHFMAIRAALAYPQYGCCTGVGCCSIGYALRRGLLHDQGAARIVGEIDAIKDQEGSALSGAHALRSEEHTSELQSLMRTSYAVFCWNKKNTKRHQNKHEYKCNK